MGSSHNTETRKKISILPPLFFLISFSIFCITEEMTLVFVLLSNLW